MNIPKRAWCHHFRRRSRSSTVEVVGPPTGPGSTGGAFSCWADRGKKEAVAPIACIAARRVNRVFITKASYHFSGAVLPFSERLHFALCYRHAKVFVNRARRHSLSLPGRIGPLDQV